MIFPTALMIVLILITISPSILWPLPKKDISGLLDLTQFLPATNGTSKITNPSAEVTDRSNQHDYGFSMNGKISESDIRASESILHHQDLREKQIIKHSAPKYLLNNHNDALRSNLIRLLWQQVSGDNLNPRSSKSDSKSLTFDPRVGIHGNNLPSQETAQLDPIYMFNKPGETAYNSPVEKVDSNEEATRPASPFGNNLFIDLLHSNQQSAITVPSNDLSIFRQKLPNAGPILYSYLTGFASSIRETFSSENDCSLIVKNLPSLLINIFLNGLKTIGKLELPESLTIPFLALNVLNFITSFLFLNKYCGRSSS